MQPPSGLRSLPQQKSTGAKDSKQSVGKLREGKALTKQTVVVYTTSEGDRLSKRSKRQRWLARDDGDDAKNRGLELSCSNGHLTTREVE